MYALIRIRGKPGISKEIEDAMRILGLSKKHICVLVNKKPELEGMIKKVKDYITWGEISEETLEKMIEKRGRLEGDKRIDKEFLKAKKIKSFKELASDVIKGKMNLKKIGIKPYFRLSPPSKGFKGSIKQHYPKGALGYRKEKINDLLKRMI